MSETNSVNVQKSRYVSGGVTEVNAQKLEWWERTVFTWAADDTTMVVDKRTAGRIDLIASALLGDSRLWWVIAQYNAILDPFGECTEGRVLRVPSANRVQTMIGGQLGGAESTREVPVTNITPIV